MPLDSFCINQIIIFMPMVWKDIMKDIIRAVVHSELWAVRQRFNIDIIISFNLN